MGFSSDDDLLLDAAQSRFERIWSGKECGSCKLRHECPRPLDQAAPPLLRVAVAKTARVRLTTAKPRASRPSRTGKPR
jgi:hypothetical protein